MKPFLIVILGILLFSSCKKEEETPLLSVEEVKQQIFAKGNDVVWGLNNKDADTLMSQFWNSDEALFIINGKVIKGYDNIAEGLNRGMAARKFFKLKVEKENVEVLTPVSALHIAEFEQKITDQNDSTFVEKGAWSAFYRFINNEWKVILVHESYYPVMNSETEE